MNRFKALGAAWALAFAGSSFAVGVPGQGTWEITLLPRDINGDAVVDAYYDTALDISWYASTSSAVLPWPDAMTWVSQTFRPFNLGGWRLPTMANRSPHDCTSYGTECGINVDPATSEMAYMFYVELGNLPDQDNTGPFSNFPMGLRWTDVPDLGGGGAWSFHYMEGRQGPEYAGDSQYVWPVHPGDVGLLVPEPSSAALLLAGLALMVRRSCGGRNEAARTHPRFAGSRWRESEYACGSRAVASSA